MKRPLIPITLTALVLLLGGGWWWRGAAARQQQIATTLPPLPDLSASPDQMREKILAADARARSVFSSDRGLVELSQRYHANGFFNEALLCYRGLQQLQPGEPRWLHLPATILAGYGDLEPALALWQRTLALAPDYLPAQIRLGEVQLKSNHPAEAGATYARILEKHSNEPYALFGLARLDFEAGRWKQAREKLETVVNISGNALGYDLIVTLYERIGLTERARSLRAEAKASGAYRDPPDPWLDELIADCYDPYRLALTAGFIAQNGSAERALALLQRAASIAPNDVSVRFQLGTLLAKLGRGDEAQTQLERCTSLAPDFADAWAHLSSLYAQRNQMVAADRILAAGLKNCPQSPGLHLMLARNHRQAGRIGESIVAYQKSIKLRPNEAEAYLELANLLIKLERNDEAIALLRIAHEAEPGNPMTLGILAFHAISIGDETEARRWLTQLTLQPRAQREQVDRLRTAYQKKFGRTF